jgi:predicted ABC-type ATPase
MADSYQNNQLIVVAGPNGSGKTTVAREIIENQNYQYISADDIAYELAPYNPLSARIQAGKEFFSRLETGVQGKYNLIIESTLSGKALLPKLLEYRQNYSYSVKIVYLFLSNPDMCSKRVAIRVRRGGHHVPYQDIVRRFGRSLDNFWNFYRKQCDQWNLIYNAEDDFQEVARFENQINYVFDESLFVTFQEMVNQYGQAKQP